MPVPRLTALDDEVPQPSRVLLGPPATHARRRATLLAACGLVVVAVAIALWVGRTGDEIVAGPPPRSEPPAPAPLVITPIPEPAPAAAPAPRTPALISVQVRVSPENAAITIDGASVIGNPFSGKYVGDGAIHQVRVTAPGHVAKSVGVEFSANVALDLNLERIPPRTPEPRREPPRPPPPRTPEPRVVAETPPPPPEPPKPPRPEPPVVKPKPPEDEAVDPAGGSQVKRPIEPNDPYGGTP
jgi:hypothetical protein